MLSSAKTYRMIPGNRRSVGCDVDAECIDNSTPSFLLVFPRQECNPISDIQVSCEVEESCKEYRDLEDRKMYKFCREMRHVSTGMIPTHALPMIILHFLSSYQNGYSTYIRCMKNSGLNHGEPAGSPG